MKKAENYKLKKKKKHTEKWIKKLQNLMALKFKNINFIK